MAVYTPVSEGDARAFLRHYDIGALTKLEPIREGVENTNYHLHTSRGRYILTLFEKRVREDDLPFFIDFMSHLAARGINAPDPVAAVDGLVIRRLCARPAVLTTFLHGAPDMRPDASACHAFGAAVAALHVAASDFGRERANDLSLSGWRRIADACGARANECAPGLSALISAELAFLDSAWPAALPRATVHADLFPDNIFFRGGAVSGVIDFYFACTDFLAYDLAIAVNAWAEVDGEWRGDNARALLAGYASRRNLGDDEIAALPVLLRGAALRFLLTRLYDWLNPVDGAVVTVKDPKTYREILLRHREGGAGWIQG